MCVVCSSLLVVFCVLIGVGYVLIVVCRDVCCMMFVVNGWLVCVQWLLVVGFCLMWFVLLVMCCLLCVAG